jgi:hypothetical protein
MDLSDHRSDSTYMCIEPLMREITISAVRVRQRCQQIPSLTNQQRLNLLGRREGPWFSAS